MMVSEMRVAVGLLVGLDREEIRPTPLVHLIYLLVVIYYMHMI